MSTISELLKQIKSLPPGNIYKKNISGKVYYYHQYFINNQRYTRIIDSSEVSDYLAKIKVRKELEKQLKNIRLSDKKIVLSKTAEKLTGQVMMHDTPVAEFDNGNLISINNQLAPLVIKRTHSIEEFLKLRMIDMSRTNARLLKRTLHINEADDYKIPLYAYALSITDNYWFKPKKSKLKYQNLIFNNDIYSDTSLNGDTSYFPHQTKLTPEITTTGSFEKGWKLIKNNWYLYKKGNEKQIFSELFCYKFAKLMNIPTASYEYDNGNIRSRNFADKYNFEPIASLAGDNDNYDHIFDILLEINPIIAKQYLKLIFFDAVVNNVDRHNENTGLMRNKRTGRIISLAPNFDNNLALISTVDKLNVNLNKDGFVSLFLKFYNSNDLVKELYKDIGLPDITKEDIKEATKDIPIMREDIDEIIDVISIRYNYLKSIISK